MKLPQVTNKFQDLSDIELFERLSLTHLRLKQLKIMSKEDKDVIVAQDKLDSVKAKYKVKEAILKGHLEKVMSELKLRNLETEIEELEGI